MLFAFITISVFALVRAERVILTEEVTEANESLPSWYKATSVEEVEELIDTPVSRLTYIPESYEQHSITYSVSEAGYEVKQLYIDPGKGHIQVLQLPIDQHEENWGLGYEIETVERNGQQVSVAHKNGDIYKQSWIANSTFYTISSTKPLSKEEWVKVMVGVKE